MKGLVLILLALPFCGMGQRMNEQVITSEIKEIKLYLTAGQMIHKENIKLIKGRNKLIFSGISTYADPQSIQFSADGDYRLVSVSTEMDFLAAERFNPRIKELKDSLESLKDRNQANQDLLDSYQVEKAVLNTNRDLGNNQSLTVAQIKEAADFYQKKTLEINKQISIINKEQKKLDLMIEDTRYQLVELNYDENQRSNQVIVLIDAENPESIPSTLKYIVTDCGWAATYDLSATEINQQINLKYKAQVYNNTGKDWENVQLTLSTADPNLSASHPELSPWYLDYYNIGKVSSKKYYAPQAIQEDYRQVAISNMNYANERVYDNYYLEEGQKGELDKFSLFNENNVKLIQHQNVANQTVQMKQIDISELTTEFDIKHTFSCPSDAKPYMVEVKEMNLNASFSHVSVPKLDKAAFLLAHITGWQELDLIPGPTHVYFGGVYVGVSEIDTRNVSDTLSLSFGRDNKVVVLRKLKNEFSEKKVMGNSKKESFQYEIQVRNNRSVPIKIDIYDQVPISKSSDIIVTENELSGGVKNIETGEVKWSLEIQPGNVASKEIGYTVKYPKNASITIHRYRTISCPSF